MVDEVKHVSRYGSATVDEVEVERAVESARASDVELSELPGLSACHIKHHGPIRVHGKVAQDFGSAQGIKCAVVNDVPLESAPFCVHRSLSSNVDSAGVRQRASRHQPPVVHDERPSSDGPDVEGCVTPLRSGAGYGNQAHGAWRRRDLCVGVADLTPAADRQRAVAATTDNELTRVVPRRARAGYGYRSR